MSPFHYFQYCIYSLCIEMFIVFTYVVFYSDLISSSFRKDLQLEYDYIIVGSGTAGSVIAHRLATETNFSFIVLEAGSSSQFLLEIPIVGPVLHGSIFDWKYTTTSQEHACKAFKDSKCRLPQGKIVGGSSKLNNMIHYRGNISHYTQWFHGKHNSEYLLKQFEFIEKELIHLGQLKHETELTASILGAAKELGYGQINEKSQIGFEKSTLSQINGKRWSISDHLDKKHILTNILVEKVLFKETTAFGVECLRFGKKTVIKARKGVILSAGTLNSPKILQLSGIGPSKLLKSLDIPVIKNLPVGQNLQDHIGSGLDLVLLNESLSLSGADILNPINALNYFLNGKGPFTTGGCEVIGFVSTKNETTPDLQFMVLPVGLSSDRGSRLRKSFGVKDAVWENYFTKTFHKQTATVLPIVLHPTSKGEVYITSKYPQNPPLIDPKYLTTREDRKVLVFGLKLIAQLVDTHAMKSMGAYLNPDPFPGCQEFAMFSDEYWYCYIEYSTYTSFHPVGTCSMGLGSERHSVIDTSFKVIGVKKLYIVDGSVLPTLPSGNINAAIAMMGSVFFDSVIKHKSVDIHSIEGQKFCDKGEKYYEFIYQVCSIRSIYN